MKKLLIAIHPKLDDESRCNRKLIYTVKSYKAVDTIKDIYSLYPDFKINVQEEQKALDSHDMIIFQYPVWWYAMPPLGHTSGSMKC